MNTYEVEDLEPGTVFECRVYSEDGKRLADPYTVLDDNRLRTLSEWGIRTIRAESAPMPEYVRDQYREVAQESPDERKVVDDADITQDATRPARSLNVGLKNQVESSFDDAYSRAEDLLEPLSKGLIQDSSRIYKVIRPMMESVWHLPKAVMFHLADRNLGKNQEYIHLYSLKTALFSVLVAHEMGMDRDEARTVGAAGVVHDVGMLKIPRQIRKKEGNYEDGERETMESHPRRGARLLREIDNLEPSVPTVAAEHHEHYDGGGYPQGISGDSIHPHSRIVHLTMTFTAMTQPRSHRKKRRTIEAVQTILTDDAAHFDPDVRRAFLNVIGFYPVGTFVQLASGHHAMVVEPDSEDPRQPTVKVITTDQGDPLSDPYLVDLSEDPDEIERVFETDIMGYDAMEYA